MAETVGNGDEDPMMRYLDEIAGSMGVESDPYRDVLRAEAAAIIEDLPTRENPIKGTDMDDLGAVIGGLAYRILDARILHAIADGYPRPPVPEGASLSEGERPTERTPGALCGYAANHPLLRDRDRVAQATQRFVDEATGDLDDRAAAMRQRRNAEMQAMAGVLGLYGVDREDMNFIPSHTAITFNYQGNTVRVSTLNGVTQVVAWDSRLTPAEGNRLWDDHNALAKQGAHLAHLNHFLQRGTMPAHLEHLARQVEADQGSITEAFDQHAQDVRAHALSGGFRDFQVHTPNIRWALPVALHLLEQPYETAYDIVGEYSATNGFIQVDEPGTFTRARRGDMTWGVNDDGSITRKA
jgi:hypothetical protein